ncbi:MAG: RNA polymerase sigma factor [Pyrinomonadaceae bacterium]
MARSEPGQKLRPMTNDERLLIEAAQRDRAQFAAVYEEYFELVYAYIARRVRDRSTVEDLTSDVFHKALASLPKFKWTGAPFASWLFRIAANLIADLGRRKAPRTETNWDQSGVEDRGTSSSAGDRTTAPLLTSGLPALSASRSAETQQSDLEDAEGRAQLFRLVEGLPHDQKRVVTLRFAEEKSIKQIAAELGRSDGAVKQLQLRALENLRKRLIIEDPENTRAKK